MRSAGNFNPEWGYLAPAPSFMRTARTVLVATAVGATAGVAVVLSLVERPVTEVSKTSVAAHALVTSVQAATPPTVAVVTPPPATPVLATAPMKVPSAAPAPLAAQVTPQLPMQTQAAAPDQSQPVMARQPMPAAGASEASTASTPGAPASIAALSEVPPAPVVAPLEVTDGIVAPEPAPAPKKAATKHRAPTPYGQQTYGAPAHNGIGPVLRHLFSARAGAGY